LQLQFSRAQGSSREICEGKGMPGAKVLYPKNEKILKDSIRNDSTVFFRGAGGPRMSPCRGLGRHRCGTALRWEAFY